MEQISGVVVHVVIKFWSKCKNKIGVQMWWTIEDRMEIKGKG